MEITLNAFQKITESNVSAMMDTLVIPTLYVREFTVVAAIANVITMKLVLTVNAAHLVDVDLMRCVM